MGDILKVLREGIWASLTGGWFFDTQQSLFVNTLHLYVWLILSLVPFIACLALCQTQTTLVLYSAFGGIFVLIFKLLSTYLHRILDANRQSMTNGIMGDGKAGKLGTSGITGSDHNQSVSTSVSVNVADRLANETSLSGSSTRWYVTSPFSEGRRTRMRRRDIRTSKRSTESRDSPSDSSSSTPSSSSTANESGIPGDSTAVNSRLKSILEEAEEIGMLLSNEPNLLSPVLESVVSESASETPERECNGSNDVVRHTATAICHVYQHQDGEVTSSDADRQVNILIGDAIAAPNEETPINTTGNTDAAAENGELASSASDAGSKRAPSRNPLALRLMRSREFREMINDVRSIRLENGSMKRESSNCQTEERFVPSLDDLKLLDEASEPRHVTRRLASTRATRSRLTNLQRFERLVAQTEQNGRPSAVEEPAIRSNLASRFDAADLEPSNAARNLTYHSSIKHRGRRGLNRDRDRDRVRERANALLARSASLNQTRARPPNAVANPNSSSNQGGLIVGPVDVTIECDATDDEGNSNSNVRPKRAASSGGFAANVCTNDVGLNVTPRHSDTVGNVASGIVPRCSSAALTSSASALPQITLQKRTQTTCSVSVSTVARRPLGGGTRRALSFRETQAQFRLGAPITAGEPCKVELASSETNTSFFALTRHGLHRRLSDRLHHLSRANKPQPAHSRSMLRKTSDHRRSLNLDGSEKEKPNACASNSNVHVDTSSQRPGLVRKISTPAGGLACMPSTSASGSGAPTGSQSHVAAAIAQSSLSLAWLYRGSLDDVAASFDATATSVADAEPGRPSSNASPDSDSSSSEQPREDLYEPPAETGSHTEEQSVSTQQTTDVTDPVRTEKEGGDEEPCCKPKRLDESNETISHQSESAASSSCIAPAADNAGTQSVSVNVSESVTTRSRPRNADRDGPRKVRLTTTRRRQYGRSSVPQTAAVAAATAGDAGAVASAALTPNSAMRNNMRSRTMPGAYQRNIRSGTYQQLWNTFRQAHQRGPQRDRERELDAAQGQAIMQSRDLDELLVEYDSPTARQMEEAESMNRRRSRGVLRSPRLRRSRDDTHQSDSSSGNTTATTVSTNNQALLQPSSSTSTGASSSAATRELRTFEEIFIDLDADESPAVDGNGNSTDGGNLAADRFASSGSLLCALRIATRQPRVRRVVRSTGDRRRGQSGRTIARHTLHEPIDDCADATQQRDTESSDDPETGDAVAVEVDGDDWRFFCARDGGNPGVCSVALGDDVGNAVSDGELSALESLQSALEHRRSRAKTPRNYFTLKFAGDLFTAKFDRLSLLALFDRDNSWVEVAVAVVLSALVSGLGMAVMQTGVYYDLWLLLFCFVLASSQYSLLKSVQPDACSPTHGFNRLVVYNRPIYFVLCCLAILLLYHLSINAPTKSSFTFYGLALYDRVLCELALGVAKIFTLSLPLLFTVGFLPQWSTLLLYLCEQIELHVFGGSGLANLRSGLYCMVKGLLPCTILSCLCYAGLTQGGGPGSGSGSGSVSALVQTGVHGNAQSVVFSIFCALLTAFAYHCSRLPNNIDLMCDYMRYFCSRSAKQVVRSALQKNKSASLRARLEAHARHKGVAQNCCLLSLQSNSDSKRSSIEYEMEMDAFSGPATSVDVGLGGTNQKAEAAEEAGKLKEHAAQKVETDTKQQTPDESPELELQDPLPEQLRRTLSERFQSDMFVCPLIGVFVFALHSSTVFTVPPLAVATTYCLGGAVIVISFLNHYFFMNLRIEIPWLCFMRPFIYPKERAMFEPTQPSKLAWFERISAYLCFAERNLLLPCLVLSYVTKNAAIICNKFGLWPGSMMVAFAGYRLMRGAYSQTAQQYIILLFTYLLFLFDFKSYSETFLLDYFLVSILHSIVTDLLLKLQFVFAYISPWQITWGSAFHAFAQPFSVPHSGLMYVQVLISALFHAPIQPFLGSAIFLMSYVRPLKFWERDYNTKRVDNSNTRLASQLADGPQHSAMNDDNNLNSIFYEHLSRVLQLQLAGDVQLGRFSNGQPVRAGDCYLLTSDYLNALLHIVEVQNGLITFQLRGLEFRGTYCQQRELEAVNECCNKHLGQEIVARSAGCLFQRNASIMQLNAARSSTAVDAGASDLITIDTGEAVLRHMHLSGRIIPFEANPHACNLLSTVAASSTASLTGGHAQMGLNATGAGGQPPGTSTCTPRDRDRDRDRDREASRRTAACRSRAQLVPFGRMWSYRFQTWRLLVQKYALETYSITDNNAATMLQMYDLRRLLITLFVKSIIFFAVRNRAVPKWLEDSRLREQLAALNEQTAIDLDPVFSVHVDEDYDIHAQGVSRKQFVSCYLEWIAYCWQQRPSQPQQQPVPVPVVNTAETQTSEITADHFLVTICYALSLFGRRALANASHFSYSTCVEFFLFGLHELFKGDFRVASPKDEWCLADVRFLEAVLKPAVRIALKLHQDHFTLTSDELADPRHLFTLIAQYTAPQTGVIVTHESDPRWRLAILANQPSLLALRHCVDDGQDEYKIIQLNRRVINFCVVSINRECVRGLWAGQQQELVYLRNRNPERGSIQNAKQVLRNMINSSCDQPLGYPIYVSPLLTSFVNTNAHYRTAFGILASLTCATPLRCLKALFLRCVRRCLKAFRQRGAVRSRASRMPYAHEHTQMVDDDDSQSVGISVGMNASPLSGSFPRVGFSHGYLIAPDTVGVSAKARSSSLPMHARSTGKLNRDNNQSGSTRLIGSVRATAALVHAAHSQHALDATSPRLPSYDATPNVVSEDNGCGSRIKCTPNQHLVVYKCSSDQIDMSTERK